MSRHSFYDKTTRPWVNARLTNASIVGHTTATEAKIWVRAWEEDNAGEPTDGQGLYWLIVSTLPIPAHLGQPQVVLDQNGQVSVVLNAAGDSSSLVPGLVSARSISLQYATDLTGTFELGGLRPATRYYYALFAGFERSQRWELGNEEALHFRTQPASATSVTFGVFSCHQPFTKHGVENIGMFAALQEELDRLGGDHVLAIGDQIYSDGFSDGDIWSWLKKVQAEPDLEPADFVSWYRDVYRGFWGFKSLQSLFAHYPTYMMLDDHEIADGWGSATPQELARSKLGLGALLHPARAEKLVGQMFDAAKFVYEEYQHAHNPSTAPRVYDYGFESGFVKTYVLDMRTSHDVTKPDGERLLGSAQLQRLADWLVEPLGECKVVFIVSPVPVVHFRPEIVNAGLLQWSFIGAKDDLRDEWEHETNLSERQKLLELVSQFSAQHGVPVLFLSGDVHMSAAFELWDRKQPAARVYQLTTSGITYSGVARVPAIANLDARVTHQKGPLAGTEERWFAYPLQTEAHNNFAIVQCGLDDGGAPNINWSLHISGENEQSVTRLERLQVYPSTKARGGA